MWIAYKRINAADFLVVRGIVLRNVNRFSVGIFGIYINKIINLNYTNHMSDFGETTYIASCAGKLNPKCIFV